LAGVLLTPTDEDDDDDEDDDGAVEALPSLPCFNTLAKDTFPPHIPAPAVLIDDDDDDDDDDMVAPPPPPTDEDTVEGDDELVVDATGEDVITEEDEAE